MHTSRPSNSSGFPTWALAVMMSPFLLVVLVLSSLGGIPRTTPQPQLAPQLVVSEVGVSFPGDNPVTVNVEQPGESMAFPTGSVSVNVDLCQSGSVKMDRPALRQVVLDNLGGRGTLRSTTVNPDGLNFGFTLEGVSDEGFGRDLADLIMAESNTNGFCHVHRRLVTGSGFPY